MIDKLEKKYSANEQILSVPLRHRRLKTSPWNVMAPHLEDRLPHSGSKINTS